MAENIAGIDVETGNSLQFEDGPCDSDEYDISNGITTSTNEFIIIRSDANHQVTNTNLSAMNMENFQFSSESREELYQLLKSWNLELLIGTCIENFVDVEAFSLMTNNFKKEFYKKIPIGVQIKLDYHLIKWQQNSEINKTITKEHDGSHVRHDTFNISPKSTNSIYVDLPINNNSYKIANLNISDLLNESHSGLQIKSFYKTNSILSDTLRNLLATKISQYMLSNHIKMSVEIAKNIASKVIELFPKENMGTYYFKVPGDKPMGKIYSNYFNQIRSLQNSGLIKKRCLDDTRMSTAKKINKPIEAQLNIETDIEENLNEIAKDNCSWAEMEQHYSATSNYRIQQISSCNSTAEILQKWVQYKKPYGYKLIEIDFKTMYPNTDNIEAKFNSFAIDIMEVFQRKIKDKNARSLLGNLLKQQGIISENGLHATILYLIHFVLPPTTRTVKNVNGQKIVNKITIKDSQQSFMLVGATAQQVEELIQQKLDEGVAVQPFIVIKGSLDNPEEIFIYFDGIKYQIFSIIRAVETCFKIFYVVNLNFPMASILIWSFIKQYFFEFIANNDRDKKHPTVGSLIAELKK